jgi:tRNA (guanine37-N1)-methyltransferase
MLTVDVLTLFPEMFAPFIGLSIVGRAQERGLVEVRLHHILDALEAGERADDTPYGGGPGMVMRLAPLVRILDRILSEAPAGERRAMILTSPGGKPFDQTDAQAFSALERLVIVCGRYEGVDDRIRALYPLQELSLGDFVLTGGEIPALAFIDATVRLLPGAMNPRSLESESFGSAGLDYPSYTRPARFRGIDVPSVLLSGNHREIAQWRREQAARRTAARRRAP